MIGNSYWSTGIIIEYDPYRDLWHATAEFYDDGFCQDESTEGEIHSRYWTELETAIDNVKADTEKLGIEWQPTGQILSRQDGEGMPANWKKILKAQADRINFNFPYQMEDIDNE